MSLELLRRTLAEVDAADGLVLSAKKAKNHSSSLTEINKKTAKKNKKTRAKSTRSTVEIYRKKPPPIDHAKINLRYMRLTNTRPLNERQRVLLEMMQDQTGMRRSKWLHKFRQMNDGLDCSTNKRRPSKEQSSIFSDADFAAVKTGTIGRKKH